MCLADMVPGGGGAEGFTPASAKGDNRRHRSQGHAPAGRYEIYDYYTYYMCTTTGARPNITERVKK
jgi:hypothetical protein